MLPCSDSPGMDAMMLGRTQASATSFTRAILGDVKGTPRISLIV